MNVPFYYFDESATMQLCFSQPSCFCIKDCLVAFSKKESSHQIDRLLLIFITQTNFVKHETS